jgi:GntR family transcriptional repressor for pyruvate dehydrogenase complex
LAAVQPIDPRKRADQVRDAIVALIRDGRLRPGEKLPTEPRLGAMFGVGRSAVRAAVQSLVGSGVIEMRPGQGAYIRRLDVSDVVRMTGSVVQLDFRSALELHEARASIELTAARLAARRRTKTDLERMRAAIDAYATAEEAGDIEGMVATDIAFHAALIGGARNRVLATMLDSISEILHEHRRQYILHADQTARGLVVSEHRGIYEAIAAADRAEAIDRVRRHLRLIWTQIRGHVEPPADALPERDLLELFADDLPDE